MPDVGVVRVIGNCLVKLGIRLPETDNQLTTLVQRLDFGFVVHYQSNSSVKVGNGEVAFIYVKIGNAPV